MNSPLNLMVIAMVVLAVTGAAAPPAGCPCKCGNLDIPFPFGIGSNCALDDSFRIFCNETYNPPRPFLQGDLQVFNISLDGYLKVGSQMALDCSNCSGGQNITLNSGLTLENFVLSGTRNELTVVGCETYAVFDSSTYTSGCTSVCNNSVLTNGSMCHGIGCCATSVPVGITNFELRVVRGNGIGVDRQYPCGYAFVAEEGFYKFSSADLLGLQKEPNVSFPVVLEWSVQDLTCREAQENRSSYACESAYSECSDSFKRKGYNCYCQSGFQGNAYIKDGCKDIDECRDSNDCGDGICINLPGNYTCSCPKGYEGDGRKYGIGCYRKDKGTVLYIIIGVTTSAGVLFLVAASFISYKLLTRRREKQKKDKIFKRNGGLLLQKQLNGNNDSVIQKTRIFTAPELLKATDNFNENRILGRGGQGTVYKGMLSDGRITAVKRSKLVDECRLEQFINEVVVLSQVVHKNVVRLLGCCLETEVPLLVYEYILNGTLYDLIHKEKDELLTWNIRLRIATEVAGALAYLHSAVSIPIYHRDIKSSNILLDEKYTAKVSDFGTSMSFGDDKTHVTTLVKGTFGYLDPEYFQSSQFTEKSDVYSFGVVLVELLTRQKAISQGSGEEDGNFSLATRFLASMEQNCLSTIIDAQIRDDYNKEEIIIVAKLAEKCLNLNGKNRPTMRELANELERIRVLKPNPKDQENLRSHRLIEVETETNSDASYTWTIGSSSVSSVPDDHPLLNTT